MENLVEFALGVASLVTLLFLTYHMVKCDTKLRGLTLTQWATWSVLLLLTTYHFLSLFAPEQSPVPVQVFLYGAELCMIVIGQGMALSLKRKDPDPAC